MGGWGGGGGGVVMCVGGGGWMVEGGGVGGVLRGVVVGWGGGVVGGVLAWVNDCSFWEVYTQILLALHGGATGKEAWCSPKRKQQPPKKQVEKEEDLNSAL